MAAMVGDPLNLLSNSYGSLLLMEENTLHKSCRLICIILTEINN